MEAGDSSFNILFYSILFYSILFYSILFYSILFYSILFYSILFYSILGFRSAEGIEFPDLSRLRLNSTVSERPFKEVWAHVPQ